MLLFAGIAASTGISKSTLWRLESGQRRPGLELLLPLAQVYRVPIDDLVGAPEVGDPRIRLEPRRVNGRAVVPLTREPDGMQVWKIIIPITNVDRSPDVMTATNGCTSCRAGCGSSWATTT